MLPFSPRLDRLLCERNGLVVRTWRGRRPILGTLAPIPCDHYAPPGEPFQKKLEMVICLELLFLAGSYGVRKARKILVSFKPYISIDFAQPSLGCQYPLDSFTFIASACFLFYPQWRLTQLQASS
jgi:hypothetical protein